MHTRDQLYIDGKWVLPMGNESIDVINPATEEIIGKIHPISQTIFSIIEIFGNLNYSVEAGPDIESDFNNFSALNIANSLLSLIASEAKYIFSKAVKSGRRLFC